MNISILKCWEIKHNRTSNFVISNLFFPFIHFIALSEIEQVLPSTCLQKFSLALYHSLHFIHPPPPFVGNTFNVSFSWNVKLIWNNPVSILVWGKCNQRSFYSIAKMQNVFTKEEKIFNTKLTDSFDNYIENIL